MKKKQYKYLFFDADNTILDYHKSEIFALSNAMKSFQLDFNEDIHLPVYKRINKACWSLFEKGQLTAEALRTKRFLDFITQYQWNISADAMSSVYLHYLRQAAFLLENAEMVLKKVKKSYKLVLITNGLKDVQHQRLELINLKQYFEAIIISDEIGFQKPDAQFFAYTLNQIGNPKKQDCLIIGDSLSSDILGGFNAEIDTCWFNPNQEENKLERNPTYEIVSLTELLNIL